MRFSQILARFAVSLFTREWIEILVSSPVSICRKCLPLYEGADWNLAGIHKDFTSVQSPSLRGSGLKSVSQGRIRNPCSLPLYEGADWNNIWNLDLCKFWVSLFTRERIEILISISPRSMLRCVSLFTRERIEMMIAMSRAYVVDSLPLYEGADWNLFSRWCCPVGGVSLFTRERIEIAQQAAFAWLFRVSLFTREWIEIAYRLCEYQQFA